MAGKIKEHIRHCWSFFFRHTRKNSHVVFFAKSMLRSLRPAWWLQKQLCRKLSAFYNLPVEEQRYIQQRVDYYCKFRESILLPDDAPSLESFTYRKRESYVHDYVNSTYFYDAYEYIRFFSPELRWAYNPGDVNYMFPVPEITKSRPLLPADENRNNIIINLDKVRHFTWVDDPFTWEEKQCRIIFRGDTGGKPRRIQFIAQWKDHPLCNLVSTSDSNYQQKQMPLYEHLKYRYIMALEGNDVASNLKWVMSSNSIAVMPRPTCETWYMEGKLIPNYHYIEIADDYHDLIEKIEYYEAHPNEAIAIIRHAHEWVAQFRNKEREDLISLMVLDKYFRLTGQKETVVKPDNEPRAQRHIFINEVVKLGKDAQVNAQSKARKDVLHTFKDLGYEEHDIINYKYSLGEGKRYHHYPFFSDFLADRQVKKFVKEVQFGDIIVIQDFYRKYLQKLAKECLEREAKVVFVVHDVQTIRFNKTSKEMRKLNNASQLIVHTQAMADKLKALGVTTPMRILWLFDYYSDDPMQAEAKVQQQKNEVVFAGNLSKSAFLKELLKEKEASDIHYRLYGMHDGSLDFSNNSNIEYAGVFKPEETGCISGGWGLVWDGDSIDSCTGDLGEYLRYNTSHKTSLYLAAGIPVIVWEQSSLAVWIKEQNIGITVKSLHDISSAISGLSNADYANIINNVRAIAVRLRRGYFMKQAYGVQTTS